MGQRPRLKPERLPAKLLAIRRHLKLSQSQMSDLLNLEISPGRISEYEHAVREPNLFALLRYSEAARVHMESLVDDRVSLRRFREALKQRKRSR